MTHIARVCDPAFLPLAQALEPVEVAQPHSAEDAETLPPPISSLVLQQSTRQHADAPRPICCLAERRSGEYEDASGRRESHLGEWEEECWRERLERKQRMGTDLQE